LDEEVVALLGAHFVKVRELLNVDAFSDIEAG
jgi:hypothetical protein